MNRNGTITQWHANLTQVLRKQQNSQIEHFVLYSPKWYCSFLLVGIAKVNRNCFEIIVNQLIVLKSNCCALYLWIEMSVERCSKHVWMGFDYGTPQWQLNVRMNCNFARMLMRLFASLIQCIGILHCISVMQLNIAQTFDAENVLIHRFDISHCDAARKCH